MGARGVREDEGLEMCVLSYVGRRFHVGVGYDPIVGALDGGDLVDECVVVSEGEVFEVGVRHGGLGVGGRVESHLSINTGLFAISV